MPLPQVQEFPALFDPAAAPGGAPSPPPKPYRPETRDLLFSTPPPEDPFNPQPEEVQETLGPLAVLVRYAPPSAL